MSTLLFNQIVYGPVFSRRLGNSLGINLLPQNGKVCSFDCLYCECGFNHAHTKGKLPSLQAIQNALTTGLESLHKQGVRLDVITFAGNGEPTLHPHFAQIIDDCIRMRDQWFPEAQLSVLSNATQLHRPDVVTALLKADNAILKMDSCIEATFRTLDRPTSERFTLEVLTNQLKAFPGKLIIQTLFTRGQYEGNAVDNTTDVEVNAWIRCIKEIQPHSVMVYTIDRETPAQSLEKIPLPELEAIAKRLTDATGIAVQVAG